jgi:hypothetical protein
VAHAENEATDMGLDKSDKSARKRYLESRQNPLFASSYTHDRLRTENDGLNS